MGGRLVYEVGEAARCMISTPLVSMADNLSSTCLSVLSTCGFHRSRGGSVTLPTIHPLIWRLLSPLLSKMCVLLKAR